jgi:hypothetical protein
MARVTKRQLIDEFNNLFDECVELYNGELKELMENHKITSGHYYYVLSPYKEYHARLFYGLENEKAMISNKNKFKIWDFEYCLKKLKNHKDEMLKVIAETV